LGCGAIAAVVVVAGRHSKTTTLWPDWSVEKLAARGMDW
jgi:hypothetical protein